MSSPYRSQRAIGLRALAITVALLSAIAPLLSVLPAATPRGWPSDDAGGTSTAGPGPQPLDILGNARYWLRNTNHGEPACNQNKVAGAQGSGPVQQIALTTGQSACWYADPTTGMTIPAGQWESLLDIATSGGAGIAFDISGTGSGTGTTINIVGPNVGSGSNRVLIVGIAQGNTNVVLTSVTWDQGGTNQAMTRIGSATRGASDVRVEMWRLTNPTSGARTLRIVSPSSVGVVVGFMAHTGVDQTTPNDAVRTSNGNGGTVQVIVDNSAPGDLVVDALGWKEFGAGTAVAGAGQTERYETSVLDERIAGSQEAGAASVTMSWTVTGIQEWAMIGVSFNPASTSVEYDVHLEVWDMPTNAVKTAIGSCMNVLSTGSDIQCLVSGVPQRVLDADDVVRVRIAHSSAAGTVTVDYDGAGPAGDSRITIPVPTSTILRVAVTPSSVALAPFATQVFTATAYDTWDNPIPGVSFTWVVTNGVGTLNSSTGSSVTLTAQNPAGVTGTVEATASGVTGSATVQVVPGPIVRVDVAPPSVVLGPFATQSFAATAYDAWDNPVPSASFTWVVTNGVGTLNSSAGSTVTLTAQPPVGATGTIEATASGVTGSATVQVVPGPIVRVDVAPPSTILLPFATQGFTATAFDAWDNPVPGAAFTWVVTNGVGTLNSSTGSAVTLTAQNPAGVTGTVEATASGVTGTATVQVVPGPIARVAVTPPNVILPPSSTQSFAATAYDAWDNPVPGAAFTWVVTNGVGTLNTSSGPSVLFTAQPPWGANGTVEATSAGVTGVANVGIGNPIPPWVAVSMPVAGAHITGAVAIGYTNSADAILLTFEYNAGAGWVIIGATSSLTGSFPWDTTGLDAAGVTLRVRVENSFAVTNQTSVFPIEVDNTPPTVAIGTILDDQATSGTLSIAYATAADVVRVDFSYFDGVWHVIGSDFTVDGSYVWSPGVPINGVTLRAVAVDEVGLTGTDQKSGVGTFVVGTNPPAIAPIPEIHVRTGVAYDLNLTFYLSDPDTPLSGLVLSTSDPANVTGLSGAYPSLRVAYAASGTYDVTLWVSDGTDTVWTIVRVIASGANPPTLLSPLGTVSFDEDRVLTDGVGNLTTRFGDADGDVLLFVILGVANISWRLHANASMDFWAPADWSGSELVRVRATDPLGGFVEAPLQIVVRPINDAPALAALSRLQWTAGESRTFNLAPYVSDVDNLLSQLVVTTDSPHVRVNGLVLTMSFPSNWTRAEISVTVSDGLEGASQPLRVTLIPAPWNPLFFLPIPVGILALALVVGMILKRENSRPVKAFVVDEKGELIREITFDQTCLVTWGQVQAAGVFNIGGNPVKIGNYQAQAVKGEALRVAIVSYGTVTKELVDLARELLVNIQAKFGERIETRLKEARDNEARTFQLAEEVRNRHRVLETRSRAFAGAYDAWAQGQTKLAKESAVVQTTVADVESREAEVKVAWHRIEETRIGLNKEREEFHSLADRLKGEMDRRNAELAGRDGTVRAEEARIKEERSAFEAMRKEKLERLAARDVEIEAKAQTFSERESAVKAQGEENARLLADLAAREETLEIEGDRIEKVRVEIDQTRSELEGSSREIAARETALREMEARKTGDLKSWQALLESRESVLREQRKAFDEQMTNLQASMISKEQALDGRAGKVGELESKVRAEADNVKRTIEEVGKREQAAQDALREAKRLREEAEAAHDALGRRSADLDARAANLKVEADKLSAEVTRREQAVRSGEAELASKRQEIQSAERFLDRQMSEIHESTRNLTKRETDLNAVEQDWKSREAKLASRAKEVESIQQDAAMRQKAIDEETTRFAKAQMEFEGKRKEFEVRIASSEAILASLAKRENEVIERENAQKSRDAGLQTREADFFRREVEFREKTGKFDETIRGLEQREAVLGSRTAKLEEDLSGLAILREETRAEKEFAEQTKSTADAQQAEVARTMKFLQKKAVDILDREELLRKREKKLEETESILDSQVEIVETQRNAIEVERAESRTKVEKLQSEIERMRAKISEAEHAPPVAASSAEAEKDIENRLKIIQQKAFALLDREERLREREEELNARERLIPKM